MGVKYQLSLQAQIDRETGKLLDLLDDVATQQHHLDRLKKQRDGCDHVWTTPVHKFPNESWCVKCGIQKVTAAQWKAVSS